MKITKKVIASVETATDPKPVEYAVSDTRSITLRFPQAVYQAGYASGGQYVDFVKTLSPDEARSIGQSLVEAADRVTAAEHVDGDD